jgi:hypothetical protein
MPLAQEPHQSSEDDKQPGDGEVHPLPMLYTVQLVTLACWSKLDLTFRSCGWDECYLHGLCSLEERKTLGQKVLPSAVIR